MILATILPKIGFSAKFPTGQDLGRLSCKLTESICSLGQSLWLGIQGNKERKILVRQFQYQFQRHLTKIFWNFTEKQ